MKDLPTLQDLFNNAVFKIPDYQRGYSWENQHRQDLLEDLELLNNKGHYTGTIVLKENGNVRGLGKKYTRYDIVDGQQRFTTILILLNVITKELKKIDNEDCKAFANGITSIYLKDRGPTGMNIYKLELDKENDYYFRNAVIEDKNGVKHTIKSHENLFKAKNQFEEYLDLKRGTEEDFLGFIYDLIDKLTQSLIFTLYKVEDDAEVGVIFEVMNDRGKPLSSLEKVKNYLIYLTGKISEDDQSVEKQVSDINNNWKEILKNLAMSKMSKNDDEDRFLRMNFILNFYSDLKDYKKDGKRVGKTSQLANVYKQLKTYFKSLEREKEYERCYYEIGQYADSLKVTSSRLFDILKPTNDLAFQEIKNNDLRKKIIYTLLTIGRMDIQSNILVLLVAIYDRFVNEPEKMLYLINLCEKYAFRVYYLVEWRSYSGQNQIYTLACDTYTQKISYEELITNLEDLIEYYSPSSKMKDHLLNRENYYQWKGLKYFLYEYEIYKCWNTIKKPPQVTWSYLRDSGMKSIEHILPQSFVRDGKQVKYWKERFNKKSHEENLNRLGNLTLVTPPENSKLSNKGFDEKKPIFKESEYKISKEVGKYNEWSEKQIEYRENILVNFALSRWGYDL